jgi:hypothetical protein
MAVLEVYRYERKFIVSESLAGAIRDFVGAYLVHDRYMDAAGPDGYRVCSLYLDTPQLALYRQSKQGIKNRYKLRIRYYDDDAAAPAFIEIKRRTSETVHKLRAAVSKPAVERFLRGGILAANDLTSNGDTSLRALAEYCESQTRLQADGVAFVDYRREAYVSNSAEGVRVTFDRQITGHCYQSACGLTPVGEPAAVMTRGVVLELKYNGRAPRWMHDLVTSFNLQRKSIPKYVLSVDALNLGPKQGAPLSAAQRHELV